MAIKILICAVGKPRASWVTSALDHYRRFLSKYAECDIRWLAPHRATTDRPAQIRRAEGERIMSAVEGERGFKVACDPQGEALDSVAFARRWKDQSDRFGGRAIVVIGGAWGIDERVRQWSDWLWSLGPSTLPHELALIVALEQLARAGSILRGESYHK
ncbi:MAG: 23S rRNA (pseudouridine(1915)-N(3))-methyltransferase RlmH [candidate division Zixibacteria bacterium]|nr:23S rRNA (pseudouridine(1915)-N(3))-methyltransferase RlmH [candidate division Zixibacteria bacterium]